MIDLTEILDAYLLVGSDLDWTLDDVARYSEQLALMLRGRVHWDRLAGEEWSMIARESEALAYLAVRAPVLVVDRSLVPESVEVEGLTVVAVPSMDAEVLTADLDTLRRFFNADRFSPEFDHAKFSFQHLYFDTVI